MKVILLQPLASLVAIGVQLNPPLDPKYALPLLRHKIRRVEIEASWTILYRAAESKGIWPKLRAAYGIDGPDQLPRGRLVATARVTCVEREPWKGKHLCRLAEVRRVDP